MAQYASYNCDVQAAIAAYRRSRALHALGGRPASSVLDRYLQGHCQIQEGFWALAMAGTHTPASTFRRSFLRVGDVFRAVETGD